MAPRRFMASRFPMSRPQTLPESQSSSSIRGMRILGWVFLAPFGALACASIAPQPAEPPASVPPEPAVENGAERPGEPAPAPAQAPAQPEAAAPPVAEKKPSACAEGMQLVEGEYCTKVEQKCT